MVLPANGRPVEAPRPLVEVSDLTVELRLPSGPMTVVDNVDLLVRQGERVAIVGETGAGKSMTARALVNLMPQEVSRVDGSIRYQGRELLGMNETGWQKIRGREIGFVFQDPMTHLNPTMRVGRQIEEALDTAERPTSPSEVSEVLELVGLSPKSGIARRYPFELSGGQRQRVLLAIALAPRPQLLIADEPTTALDVTIQAQILDTLWSFTDELGMALMLITHDLGVVSELCDRVYVMYAGQVVEAAQNTTMFTQPLHPYTDGLLKSILSVDHPPSAIYGIPGSVPDLRSLPEGCRFAPRCDKAMPQCSEVPPFLGDSVNGVRCWLHVDDQVWADTGGRS